MAPTCPSCGNREFDPLKQCICGYNADETYLSKTGRNKLMSIKNTETGRGTPKGSAAPEVSRTGAQHIIKEVDSWIFTFSPDEECIRLGTPALKSFSLKLTSAHLEELLEFLYRKTGKEKTMRKLQLTADETTELVENIYSLIEEKRSKIPVVFERDELKRVVDFINLKLKN